MKPLKLVMQGIRSFSERVEIDFEAVSKNGLFGIFGATGSGKSTILDSVIIALYGEISGHKMAELISARCKSAYVGLNFELSHKNCRRSYFVERNFKLKKDGSYGGAIASLYETTCGASIVLASQTNDVNRMIEDILGLGQNEFTKCIILPQGEFSQFVKASKADRVKIIEKLFSLERYGERFNEKLKAKLSGLSLDVKLKEEALRYYEQDTKEALDEERKKLSEVEVELKTESEKLLKITDYIEKNQYYYNLSKQLIADEEKLAKLNGEIEKIAELKACICLYDNAVGICDEAEKLSKLTSEIDAFKKELLALNEILKNAENECEVVKSEYSRLDELKAERKACEEKKEKLLSAQGEVNRYTELKSLIKACGASVDTLTKELALTKQNTYDLAVSEENLLSKSKELEEKNKAGDLFSTIGNAALKDEYEEQVEYYTHQTEEIGIYSNCESLYGYVTKEFTRKLNEYQEKMSKLNLCCDSSLENSIEQYKQFMQIKKQIDEDLRMCSAQKARAEELESSLAQTLENKQNELVNLQKESAELNVKLFKIVDNIDSFESNIVFVSDKIRNLQNREENISKDFIVAKENLAKAQFSLKAKEVEISSFEKQRAEQNNVVLSKLNDNISTVEKARKIKSEIGDVDLIKRQITDFDKDFDFYQKSVSRMRAELSKVSFDLDKYNQSLKEKQDVASICENLKENLINYQNNIEKLSQNLNKRCIIEKDLLYMRARESVYTRLEQAVSRRAFSEFISAEFLSDVARTARKTLLKLTGGKYDVTYKDSLDGAKDGFYILDNLNGGMERPVSSLSGGETFLVSLSLALALSAGIYAGSDRPMEFFFLDEGFGTLDENLIEVVLDSLEKLRNSNFSIGLISHLSEMKSRIDSKITVLPSDELHGSRVVISN